MNEIIKDIFKIENNHFLGYFLIPLRVIWALIVGSIGYFIGVAFFLLFIHLGFWDLFEYYNIFFDEFFFWGSILLYIPAIIMFLYIKSKIVKIVGSTLIFLSAFSLLKSFFWLLEFVLASSTLQGQFVISIIFFISLLSYAVSTFKTNDKEYILTHIPLLLFITGIFFKYLSDNILFLFI